MAETPLRYHRPLIPLGLAYLGAMIEDRHTAGAWSTYVENRVAGRASRGYKRSGIVDAQDNMLKSFYGDFSYKQLRDRIAAHASDCNPDELYIGISILSDGMHGARHLLRHCRADFPRATLIVGGPHATFFPYDFYELPEQRHAPLADYVVRNEGELAILGIIDGRLSTSSLTRENGERFGVNPHLCDFQDGYRVIDGGQYRQVKGHVGAHVLDSLPPPGYFLFESPNGTLPYEPDNRYGLRAPAANINSSRGCPYKCTFCTIPMLAPGYRTLSPSRVLQLLSFLADEYGVQSVFFREDNFLYEGGTVPGSRWNDIAEICSGVRDRLSSLRWAIEARADSLLHPCPGGGLRLDTLVSAGLSGIYMGVESGSDSMLKLYGKGSTVREMSDAVKACSERGAAVVATACYSDPDIFFRRMYPLIEDENQDHYREIARLRETILMETRSFMNAHEIPLERREEYALVGIPVSATYKLLDRERGAFPKLVEHYDPISRYIYPKGFRWWANRIYEARDRVRASVSYDYEPTAEWA